MKKYISIGLLTLLILITTSLTFAQCTEDDPGKGDAPVWGDATIDGKIFPEFPPKSEWDLDETYFADLYRAGITSKPVTAKLYVMYNYVTNVMSVLVLNEPGYETNPGLDPKEFWVKYHTGAKLIDGNSPDFEFVNNGDYNGWEAKFYYGYCGCDYIEIHHYQKDEETSANYEVPFYIDCALPVELSSFTVENLNGNVVLNWTTESEIENQGFLIERRELGDDWQEIASYLTNADLQGQGTVTYSTSYEFVDRLVQADRTYEYRLADVDYNSVVEYHSVRTVTIKEIDLSVTPDKFAVKPAYPNPFNPSTNIEYTIPKDGRVNITIYDLTGHRVSSLVNKEQAAGWHKVRWSGNDDNGTQMPAGIYLVTVNTGNSIKTMKLVFVK